MRDPECRSCGGFSRREMLTRAGLGIGGLGLATLLHEVGLAGNGPSGSPLAAREPHFAPKAKRVIQIFSEGGPSQVDTFDPKPALTKYDGQQVDDVVKDYGTNALKSTGERVGGTRLSGKL